MLMPHSLLPSYSVTEEAVVVLEAEASAVLAVAVLEAVAPQEVGKCSGTKCMVNICCDVPDAGSRWRRSRSIPSSLTYVPNVWNNRDGQDTRFRKPLLYH